MKIREGGYYRRRDMNIEGPLKRNGDQWQAPHGTRWGSDGQYGDQSSEMDLIAEVEVRDVLPCELRAGAKYNTVKPDGTAGPVVKLEAYIVYGGAGRLIPFTGRLPNDNEYYVCRNGDCESVVHCEVNSLRITGEFIEPKPPTPLERLEKWHAGYMRNTGYTETLDAIIADLKAEATK